MTEPDKINIDRFLEDVQTSSSLQLSLPINQEFDINHSYRGCDDEELITNTNNTIKIDWEKIANEYSLFEKTMKALETTLTEEEKAKLNGKLGKINSLKQKIDDFFSKPLMKTTTKPPWYYFQWIQEIRETLEILKKEKEENLNNLLDRLQDISNNIRTSLDNSSQIKREHTDIKGQIQEKLGNIRDENRDIADKERNINRFSNIGLATGVCAGVGGGLSCFSSVSHIMGWVGGGITLVSAATSGGCLVIIHCHYKKTKKISETNKKGHENEKEELENQKKRLENDLLYRGSELKKSYEELTNIISSIKNGKKNFSKILKGEIAEFSGKVTQLRNDMKTSFNNYGPRFEKTDSFINTLRTSWEQNKIEKAIENLRKVVEQQLVSQEEAIAEQENVMEAFQVENATRVYTKKIDIK